LINTESTSTPPYPVEPGSRFPPGASLAPGGINFCVFARYATRVELLLYASPETREPFQIISLVPERNRTFFYWHVLVLGLPLRTCYTWRVDGPRNMEHTGFAFDSNRELLDPYAHAVFDNLWKRPSVAEPFETGDGSHRAIVVEPVSSRGLRGLRNLDDAVIYELHVGGFTRDRSSGVKYPGTFAGLIEKIPYLKRLGITHVELLPVMAFDEQDVPLPVAAKGLENYWGYSTHSYYSPHPRYCLDPARAPQEFRALTDALHDAGIDVLLDVVFNHTAEGGASGPVINFKGLANDIFYHLDADDRRRYRDYTGCGNTVSCNHPLVVAFIVRCLEYWVEVLGVDGFRFDLASVFARDQHGDLMSDPPLPWAIETSRILAHVPLIAEAWDAAGLYQVGAFPGMAWAEWNGRYRDVMRRFVRGDPGMVGEVATCIAGSADLYMDDGRLPANSINFVTCHDGFTLHDLVSYNAKHNQANGEENRDGSNDNLSWNCGVEGDTADTSILRLRSQQARNLMTLLFLSQGVPMLLAGDEVLRSQRGNNNGYCQNNPLSWFDWRLSDAASGMLRFVRELIALRKRHASLRRRRFLTGRTAAGKTQPDVSWHGESLNQPPWHDPHARMLAFTLGGELPAESPLHVILNMDDRARQFALPALDSQHWHRIVDTARNSPLDIVATAREATIESGQCLVEARSVVVLEANSAA
jgi:isoamylase